MYTVPQNTTSSNASNQKSTGYSVISAFKEALFIAINEQKKGNFEPVGNLLQQLKNGLANTVSPQDIVYFVSLISLHNPCHSEAQLFCSEYLINYKNAYLQQLSKLQQTIERKLLRHPHSLLNSSSEEESDLSQHESNIRKPSIVSHSSYSLFNSSSEGKSDSSKYGFFLTPQVRHPERSEGSQMDYL